MEPGEVVDHRGGAVDRRGQVPADPPELGPEPAAVIAEVEPRGRRDHAHVAHAADRHRRVLDVARRARPVRAGRAVAREIAVDGAGVVERVGGVEVLAPATGDEDAQPRRRDHRPDRGATHRALERHDVDVAARLVHRERDEQPEQRVVVTRGERGRRDGEVADPRGVAVEREPVGAFPLAVDRRRVPPDDLLELGAHGRGPARGAAPRGATAGRRAGLGGTHLVVVVAVGRPDAHGAGRYHRARSRPSVGRDSCMLEQTMRGLTCLVTGATGGLGSLVCKALVARGAIVVAHDRSRAELDALVAALGPSARGVVADFAALAEVAALARDVGPVDVLVSNAGVGFGRDQLRREVSRDGFELRLAVNYLAPFVLTYALLDRVRAVVQVASAGQRALDFADLNFERGYDGIVAYRRSKLAQVMLAFDVAARVASNALHPGTFLDTPMLRESGIAPLGTAAEGADAIVHVIERTLAGTTGQFFDQQRLARADPLAYDLAVRRQLRERTVALLAPHLRGWAPPVLAP